MKETKKVGYVHSYESMFGWKVVNTRHWRSGPHTKHEYTLERDLNINSDQLAKLKNLETRYKLLEMKSQYVPSADPETAFLLFLLLIFPGIIYLCVKHKEKEQGLIEQEAALKEMEEIKATVRSYIGRS